MLLKPFPTEVVTPLRATVAAEDHRDLFCVHYDGCLDVAVRQGWAGWTCARCPLLGKASKPPTPENYANSRRKDA